MTTLKTVQEEKTINKTSAETTAIPNQSMKGGAPMNLLKAACKRFLQLDNNDQKACKDNNYSYTLVSKLEATSYFRTLSNDELKELAQATLLVDRHLKRMNNHTRVERKLNRAYGKETTHPSTTTKETLSNMEQQSRAMRATSRKATAKTHQAINRAIKAEQQEEQLEIVEVLTDDYIKGDA